MPIHLTAEIMKGSEAFEATIREYLTVRANTDEKFAEEMKKEGKSVHECCNFILNTVKKSGVNGFCDDEIFSLAVHYYDEDITEKNLLKDISGQVVINHKVKFSEEEKKQIEEKAKSDYYAECIRKQKESNKPKSKKKTIETPDLFGGMS